MHISKAIRFGNINLSLCNKVMDYRSISMIHLLSQGFQFKGFKTNGGEGIAFFFLRLIWFACFQTTCQNLTSLGLELKSHDSTFVANYSKEKLQGRHTSPEFNKSALKHCKHFRLMVKIIPVPQGLCVCVLACSHWNGGHTLTYNNAPFSTTLVWGTDGDLISIPLMVGVICTITIISQFFSMSI